MDWDRGRQQCRMTGLTEKDTEGHGLIRLSGVSRVVAGGAIFLYLRIVLELVPSLSVSSKIKQFTRHLTECHLPTESLILYSHSTGNHTHFSS